MEKHLLIYGFEIDKSASGAHWKVYNENIVDENGQPIDFSLWRPHGRGENFLSPRTKKLYLEYIYLLNKVR